MEYEPILALFKEVGKLGSGYGAGSASTIRIRIRVKSRIRIRIKVIRIDNTGKKCILEERWRLAAVPPGPLPHLPPGPGHAREGQVPCRRNTWRN
jgi:hypothetical protein